MAGIGRRGRLRKEALIAAYAMSRLDVRYLEHRGLGTWQRAFQEAAGALGVTPSNMRLLRDEFDPLHENLRKGWHFREMRPSRQETARELEGLSDTALIALVDGLIRQDVSALEVVLPGSPEQRSVNVAERLKTGRLAEEYFLENCENIIDISRSQVLDMRYSALGFDFGIAGRPQQAIEVKGMKAGRGEIQFTDREWAEAKHRRASYHLIVVGNLAAIPSHKVVQDPYGVLDPRCIYQRSITASWRSAIELPTGA